MILLEIVPVRDKGGSAVAESVASVHDSGPSVPYETSGIAQYPCITESKLRFVIRTQIHFLIVIGDEIIRSDSVDIDYILE